MIFIRIPYALLTCLILFSCSKNEPEIIKDVVDEVIDEIIEEEDTPSVCEPTIYLEKDGLLNVNFENIADTKLNNWTKSTTLEGFSGDGYIVWTGNDYFGSPGTGIIKYNIRITTPGTYRFIWKSRITKGTSGTEHNDSWLRFTDADDFYGKKGTHYVYPGGTGKTPTPNGASKNGWFKIFMNTKNTWIWSSNTSDNDGHAIYVQFNKTGDYTMEISARSSYHALDKFVLFNNTIKLENATSEEATLSDFICN